MTKKSAISAAALIAVAAAIAGCETPERTMSLKDSASLSTPLEPNLPTNDVRAKKIKSPVGIGAAADLAASAYHSAICYILRKDCLRCEAYLPNAERSKIPAEVARFKEAGPDALADRLNKRLTEWRSYGEPPFGRQMPKHLQKLRTQLVFDATVLGDVVAHDGRYQKLIESVCRAVRCEI